MKKIYLAWPLWFSESWRDFIYNTIMPKLKSLWYEILFPWELSDDDYIKSVFSMPDWVAKTIEFKKMNTIIWWNNAKAIQECDYIFAVLDGVDVDSGTASEIGYGACLWRKIIWYRSDYRRSWENEWVVINLQVQYFIELNQWKIISTINELSVDLFEK